MKHKPWRAAAETGTGTETETETETAAAETAPDQNHNIPEISNFGDIIIYTRVYIYICCIKAGILLSGQVNTRG